jgi:carbon starvation protein CstA
MIGNILVIIKELFLLFAVVGIYAVLVMYIMKLLNFLPDNYFSYIEIFTITLVGMYVFYFTNKILSR